MWGPVSISILAALAALGPATAMTGHASKRCSIIAAEKLPADIGKNLICDEIARAMERSARSTQYSVQVTILSASRLSGVLVVSGKTLPEQNFAVMDRDLDLASIRRFAESLASQVAKAAK